jgi:hypothetical protein
LAALTNKSGGNLAAALTEASLSTPACMRFSVSPPLLKCSSFAPARVCRAPRLRSSHDRSASIQAWTGGVCGACMALTERARHGLRAESQDRRNADNGRRSFLHSGGQPWVERGPQAEASSTRCVGERQPHLGRRGANCRSIARRKLAPVMTTHENGEMIRQAEGDGN